MTSTPTKSRQHTLANRSVVVSPSPLRLQHNALVTGTKRPLLQDPISESKRNRQDPSHSSEDHTIISEPSNHDHPADNAEAPSQSIQKDTVALDKLGWPLIGSDDEQEQADAADESDSPLSSFLADRPSRRQLFSDRLQSEVAQSDGVEDDDPDRMSRRSTLFEAVLGEDFTGDDWIPDLPTSPPRINKVTSRLVYDDAIDEFFSSSHVDDDLSTERIPSSAMQRMWQPEHTNGRPAYITRHPHFLTKAYFETNGPTSSIPVEVDGNDDDDDGEEDDRSPLSATPYFEAEFHILGLLGSGDFADVYKARDAKKDMLVAVKCTKTPFCGFDDRWQQIIEVAHMQDLKGSRHCVEIVEAWEQQGHLYVEMELCQCGSLAGFIAFQEYSIPEETVWNILYETSLGVQDIHHADIIHLDIKPSNILIDKYGSIKIGDFGVSVRYPVDLQWVKGEGDRRYMAPDLLRDQFNKPVDIFSLGMVVLEMVTGIVLPDTGTAWENLRVGDFSDCEQELSRISPEMRTMVEWLLNTRAEDRPSIDAVLKHARLVAIAEEKQKAESNGGGVVKGVLYDYAERLEALRQEEPSLQPDRNIFCTPQSQIASPNII